MKDRKSDDFDLLGINTIRTLTMDAVQQANSGHPGTAMAMAPVAYCLWKDFLRYHPDDPLWANRDRFVLSIGHASMLLYSILHLFGVRRLDERGQPTDREAVTMEDIRNFRQLGSVCAGHPEFRLTSGVETTTGPLGQGVAVSVGMAMASKWMAASFNRPGHELFSYDVFALCGDGCLMEGVSSEAASLAGHCKLSNLCWVYDNNRITIEGSTDLTFSEDVAARFMAYGWNVTRVGDANDLDKLRRAFTNFRNTMDRPTLIIVDSHIAYGSPTKQDTPAAHGEPLGGEEIRRTKKNYGWLEEASFYIPDGIREHLRATAGARGRDLYGAWQKAWQDYELTYPELFAHLKTMKNHSLPEGWEHGLPTFPPDEKGLAGRAASGKVLNALARQVPWIIGGSADLGPSTKTLLTFEGAGDFSSANYAGRNIHFGVREHAMASILNGLGHCCLRPYGSGFLIFSDYARPAIRLSAMMELHVIHIFTHDSISIGEDGPTHQPVEHLASLRAIPGLITLRPADANEVVEAWKFILQLKNTPVALVLSRQAVPTIDRTAYRSASGLHRGAYILADPEEGPPDLLLLATGSEVILCLKAFEALKEEGIQSRVVSMPSWEVFEDQDQEYKDTVLPPDITARISVEQASTLGWPKYVGPRGISIGMATFGASAPHAALQKKFGFTIDNIVSSAKAILTKKKNS
ncbi:MAG TPA: transketolase [Thermoanaerobaculia bacterium]|nr:transketolase [Thermoanaerobaculia bacterium]HUM29809.1 transketolase [Thermoanaerobaculia bacterium]HXK68084.1 transketolase [Thermoanaerobaculia bacterium]